jgi:RHS repeat-associated protein
MERRRKRRFVDKQKRNFFVFQYVQAKWIAILTVLFFSLSLFQPAFIALAKQNDKPFPRQLGGNFGYQHRDLTIPTHGFRLSVTRTYNSQSLFQGLFGYGWQFEFDLKVLRVPGENQLYLLGGDGSLLSFKHDPKEKAYVSREKGWQTITKQTNGSYLRTLQGGRRHYFDSAGRLLKMADLNGNELVLTYSDNGNLLKITASTDQWLEFFYDANGNITRIADPLNRTYTYQVDRHGDLVSFSDPLGRTTMYRYDAFHNLTEIRYPDNSVKKIAYDTERDLMVEESGPGSARKRYKYDPGELSVSIKDSREKTTKIVYTPDFKKQTIIDPLGGKTVLEFDDDHLIVRIKDPAGHQRSFNYDDYGNLITITNALGYSTQFSYDPKLNLPVEIVDILGQCYAMKYDEQGNVTSLINPEGSKLRFTYNGSGNLKEFIDENGHKTKYEYNSSGYLTKVFDNLGNLFEAQYNQAGQIQKRIDPDGTWVSFRYSPTDLIISVTESGRRISRFTYDNMDRLISTVDPKGNKNFYTYDLNGKLIAHKDPLGHKTLFDRDKAGNVSRLTDPNGNITRYRYDAMNRLIEKIDAGNNRFKYAFDSKGQIIAATDAKGQTIRYTYNPLGRLVNKQYPDGSLVHLSYNPAKKVTAVQGPDTSLIYSYDTMNRVVSKQDVMLKRKLLYSYDAVGQVIKITASDDLSIQYAYDGRGRMTSISNHRGERTEYLYDTAGRRNMIKHINRTSSRFTYDEMGRISKILHQTGAGKLIASVAYTYDMNDNRIAAIIDGRQTCKFTYDALNRLLEETTPDGERILYTYDPVGNRLEAAGSESTEFKYDSLNRLVRAGHYQYNYDVNGNLTEKITPDGIIQYSYDADKNLSGVKLPDGKNYIYDYNAYGTRISKQGPKGKTFYLYDREDVLAELGPDKKLDRLYIHGPGIDDLTSMIIGKKSYTVHADGLSNIVALADKGQQVVSRYDYSAFGQVKPVKETIAIPFLFTGARYDAESGLYHLRSRAYDPHVGRFISPDSIDIAGGINLYAYVNNNPVNFVDPYGKFVGTVFGTIFGGFVGGVGAMIRHGNEVTKKDIGAGIAGGATSGFYSGFAVDVGVFVVGAAALSGPAAIAVLVVAGAVGGGYGSYWGSAAEQGVSKGSSKINWEEAETASKWGTFFGALSGGVAARLSGIAGRTKDAADAIRKQLEQATSIEIWQELSGQLSRSVYTTAVQNARHSVLTTVFTEIADETQTTISHFNQPPVDNEACLNKARGIIAAAREKAKSAQLSLSTAASSASTVQTSVRHASEAANNANKNITAADRVISRCEALPWPFDPVSAQSKAEHAAKEGKSLVPIAVSYSSEACGFVQRATSESNEAALRIWHKKAAFLTKAINSKAGTLEGLIKNAQSEVETIERMRRTMETAKKEAQQAVANLSSAFEPLNAAQGTLNSMEDKITEAQGQIVTTTSDAESAASLKTNALKALSDCTSAEGLKNEIKKIKVPSGSEIEKVRSATKKASADLVQARATISSTRSRITEKKEMLTDCAALDTAGPVIESAKAATAMAKTDLSQVKTEGAAAASCANQLAKYSPDKRDDDLVRAMADLQSFPSGTGRENRTAGGSATSPEDLIKAFSDAPATRQSGEGETIPTIGRDPDQEDVSDLEKQAREKEVRIREEEARKTQAKKKEDEDYDRKWTGITQAIADLTRQQEEINLEKLKGKQKEGEQLLDAARQETGAMLSDSDFQDKLDKMQSDFDAAKKALDEDIARSRRSSGSIECARDFTYGDHFTFNCNCDNYVFDFSKGRCVLNKTLAGTGPIVRQTPDKSGLSDVVVNKSPTILTVWDHGTEDLDRVNISLNGQPVRSNLTLRNARQNITLYLRPGNNTLKVKALNIGDPEIQKQKRLPPGNAAAVEIQGVVSGKTRQKWILMTGDVGSMQIYYQP